MSVPDDHSAGSSPQGGGTGPKPLFVAPTPEELDRLLPQFEVLGWLGQGGMGAVYKARQPRLDRIVAIKLLPVFEGLEDHGFEERFEREARAMARLNHPNIVTVHDFGETQEGHHYIVMEYVDGTDLHSAIATGQLTMRHALSWVPQICKALQYAHEHGVVHRDIKPANILINKEGEVKVGDFGLAKLVGLQKDRSLTQTQVSMGTPDYAAPEALDRGHEVDHRADIYSLGVLFYELLTGKVPRGAWRPPSSHKDIDSRLDAIIVKAMQPDPGHRYQSVEQLSKAIEELKKVPRMMVPKAGGGGGGGRSVVTGPVPVSAASESRGLRTAKPKRQGMHPVLVASIALGSTALVVGMLLVLVTSWEDVTRPPVRPPGSTVASAAGSETGSGTTPPREGTDREGLAPDGPAPPSDNRSTPPRNEKPKDLEAPRKPEPPPRSPAGNPPEKPAVKPAVKPDRPDSPSEGSGMPVRFDALQPTDGWVNLLDGMDRMRGLLRVDWELVPDGLRLETQRGRALGGKSRAVFPRPVGPDYEARMTLRFEGEVGPVLIHLPAGDNGIGVAIGPVAEGTTVSAQDEQGFFMALIGISSQEVEDAETWPTNRSLELEPDRGYELLFRVFSKPDRGAVQVFLDDAEMIRWTGSFDEGALLSPVRGPIKFLVSVSSEEALLVEEPAVRSFPAGLWLGDPVPPVPAPPSATELLTMPEPVEIQDPAMFMPREDGIRNEISQMAEKFALEEKEFARDSFVTGVLNLNESYNAALNRLLEGPVSIPVESAAKRELTRLREGKGIEPEDPPEMPQEVAVLRGRYREKLTALEADLNLAIIPLLREHLAELGTLYNGLQNEGADEGDLALVEAATVDVTRRLEALLARATVPGTGSALVPGFAPGTAEPLLPPLVLRRPFPPERPLIRGAVRIWPRDISVAAPTSLLAEVPSGLSTTAVAIAGDADNAVSLKYNGTIDLWGDFLPTNPDLLQELEVPTTACRVALAEQGGTTHLAALLEDGSIFSRIFGTRSITPLDPGIRDAVDFAITDEGGVAIRQDGTLAAWGRLGQIDVSAARDVARVAVSPGLVIALQDDGTVLRYGPLSGLFLPSVSRLIDVVFSTSERYSAVGLLPDGTIITTGFFSEWMSQAGQLARDQPVTRLAGGYAGFGVRVGEDDWHFFASGLTGESLSAAQTQAKGCSDVVIGRHYLIGLHPN